MFEMRFTAFHVCADEQQRSLSQPRSPQGSVPTLTTTESYLQPLTPPQPYQHSLPDQPCAEEPSRPSAEYGSYGVMMYTECPDCCCGIYLSNTTNFHNNSQSTLTMFLII